MQVSLNSQNSVFWDEGEWDLFRVCSQLNLPPQMSVALALMPSFFWWTTKLSCFLLHSEGTICHNNQKMCSVTVTADVTFFMPHFKGRQIRICLLGELTLWVSLFIPFLWCFVLHAKAAQFHYSWLPYSANRWLRILY